MDQPSYYMEFIIALSVAVVCGASCLLMLVVSIYWWRKSKLWFRSPSISSLESPMPSPRRGSRSGGSSIAGRRSRTNTRDGVHVRHVRRSAASDMDRKSSRLGVHRTPSGRHLSARSSKSGHSGGTGHNSAIQTYVQINSLGLSQYPGSELPYGSVHARLQEHIYDSPSSPFYSSSRQSHTRSFDSGGNDLPPPGYVGIGVLDLHHSAQHDSTSSTAGYLDARKAVMEETGSIGYVDETHFDALITDSDNDEGEKEEKEEKEEGKSGRSKRSIRKERRRSPEAILRGTVEPKY